MSRTEWKFNWVKPLKRSEKVRRRKELERQKQQSEFTASVFKKGTNGWVQIAEGAQVKIDKNMWGYKI